MCSCERPRDPTVPLMDGKGGPSLRSLIKKPFKVADIKEKIVLEDRLRETDHPPFFAR